MKWAIAWVVFVAWLAMGYGVAVILPIQDIKHGQRVIAVSDPNRGTLTLVPGAGEVWICVPYGLAQKSCKKAQDVVGWILQNGQSLSGIEPSEYVAFHAGDGHE